MTEDVIESIKAWGGEIFGIIIGILIVILFFDNFFIFISEVSLIFSRLSSEAARAILLLRFIWLQCVKIMKLLIEVILEYVTIPILTILYPILKDLYNWIKARKKRREPLPYVSLLDGYVHSP